MRDLVKQYMDDKLSRRGFMKEVAALGVTAASAEALLSNMSEAKAQEATPADATAGAPVRDAQGGREVTGNGADLLCETMLEANITHLFHGCGAGIGKFFDSVVTRPQFKNFLATNEGQCVAMAEGYHMASGGEVGAVMIPKPGLGNAAGNVHNAMANRSSLLVMTARESGETSERRGNIELIDWQEMMDPLMKWSYRMYDSERVPEFARRAIQIAQTAPGGPVFLQHNEDLYKEEVTARILPQSKFEVASSVRADPAAITELAELLIQAENPLIMVGLEVTKSKATQQLVELADLLAIPVTTGWSPYADFPSTHPLYLGRHTPFIGYMRDCDLFIALGAQIPERSNYILTGPPPKNAKYVQISMEPKMLAIHHPTEVSIVSDARAAIEDLIDAIKAVATKDRIASIQTERFARIKATTDQAREKRITGAQRTWDQAPMTTARVSSDLNELLDDNAIIVGEPLLGAPDWMDFADDKKMMLGPTPGEVLGWGSGVALGAKLAQPDRQVVSMCGDGAFMFQNNLWSLARYDAPVLQVIYNNHGYNMNRAFGWGGNQGKAKQDLVTYLGDPDVNFVHMAKAFGIDGEVAEDPDDLRNAIQRGINATREGKPYMLDIQTERWGPGGEMTWHPEISIAEMRTKKV